MTSERRDEREYDDERRRRDGGGNGDDTCRPEIAEMLDLLLVARGCAGGDVDEGGGCPLEDIGTAAIRWGGMMELNCVVSTTVGR